MVVTLFSVVKEGLDDTPCPMNRVFLTRISLQTHRHGLMLRPRVRNHIYLYILYQRFVEFFPKPEYAFTIFVLECSGESLLERYLLPHSGAAVKTLPAHVFLEC